MAFIRKVKTSSGATAVQIAHKEYGRVCKIEHIGSAHSDLELETLISLARTRLYGNQESLFSDKPSSLKVSIRRSYSKLLWLVLKTYYDKLGFDEINDDIFTSLCIARIVEPTSKIDSIRVLTDLGLKAFNKNQIYRCLQNVTQKDYRKTVSNNCYAHATHSGISLVLYDVTTLYFEVQKEDEYRKPGLSKERRLEPQIVIGLLVDQSGFPLGLHSFEGNMAETKTIIPVINAFRQEHNIQSITVVADAAMLSAHNLSALTSAGYSYIVGSRLNKIPYDIAEYQKRGELEDGQIVTSNFKDHRVVYQYKTKRASLDIRNIEKQIAKARRVVAGETAPTKTKFLTLKANEKILNQALIDKAYALAGIKGYVTNLDISNEQVIAHYHELFKVEASFRMAKTDLKARPIFHRKRESIEAHLTIVLTALAMGKYVEAKSGLSIKNIVNTLRPVRSGVVTINGREYEAEEELTEPIQNLLNKLQVGH